VGDVTCVRCSRTLALEAADIVGNGYRCAACTVVSESLGEDGEVADNVTPEQREKLAKEGKRRFFTFIGAGTAALGTPAVIGLVAAGPIGAALGGLMGLYFVGSVAGSAGEISWAQWRRYRTPPLPTAKLRK
jgi:hypothetical protein